MSAPVPEAIFIPVHSDPPGAQIFLNGQPMASTPLAVLRVPAEGRQELVIRLSGYREWKAVVDPELPLSDPVRLNPDSRIHLLCMAGPRPK